MGWFLGGEAAASGNWPLGMGAGWTEPHVGGLEWAGLLESESWRGASGTGCEEACVSGVRERCFRILEAPSEVSGW